MALCEFKTGLVYRMSLRPAWATLRHCLKKLKKKIKRVSLLDIIAFVSLLGHCCKVGDEASRKKILGHRSILGLSAFRCLKLSLK